MKILTKDEILDVDINQLPMLVLSYNYRDIVSSLINIRKKSHYNHLMWYYRPGWFASQGMFFSLDKAEKFLDHHRLKFWYNPDWTVFDKAELFTNIKTDLEKPKFRTRYDWLAIIGQLVGLTGIQNPMTKICSDYGGYLKRVDSTYNLKHPAPSDVNEWLKGQSQYKIWGRYLKD